MANFLCININWFGTGLTNQMFFIAAAIIRAYTEKIPILIFEKFRLQPCTNMMCPIKDIIDLNYLNKLTSEYNIKVFDFIDTNLTLISVKYGTDDLKINITDEIIANYFTKNKLFIPKSVYLNNIKGDPVSGQCKKLYIKYKINEYLFTQIFDEHNRQDISIDLTYFQEFIGFDSLKVNRYDPKIFNSILKSIRFTNLFNNMSEHCLLVDKNNEYVLNDFKNSLNKLNVIHIRLENDMTYNMSVHNKMVEKDYITALEDKYINLIKTHFSPEDNVLVLSYDSNNRVIKFMKENNYNIFMTKKNVFEGREPHAIIDLLVGEKCTGTLIGNWNHKNSTGSTFSYVLDQRIEPKLKRVFIDIYNISSSEVICN